MFATDPEHRAAYIDGLRQLADYLAAHPCVPVPAHDTEILVVASPAEDGGITEILSLSIELAASFAERNGFYRTSRKFGPVTYMAISQTTASMASFLALNSYYGCVTPDD